MCILLDCEVLWEGLHSLPIGSSHNTIEAIKILPARGEVGGEADGWGGRRVDFEAERPPLRLAARVGSPPGGERSLWEDPIGSLHSTPVSRL